MLWSAPLLPQVEQAFSQRTWPRGFVAPENWPLDQNWKSLTEISWRGHAQLLDEMPAAAFCYYLPSILVLSERIRSHRLEIADRLIEKLMAVDVADQAFLIERFRLMRPEERAVLSEWLGRISRFEIYPPEHIVEAFQTLLWLNGLAAKWPVQIT
jgi:hypothetical protein